MEIITDGSGDGIALPFTAKLALHTIDLNLPIHPIDVV